jgi:hypothetical protein
VREVGTVDDHRPERRNLGAEVRLDGGGSAHCGSPFIAQLATVGGAGARTAVAVQPASSQTGAPSSSQPDEERAAATRRHVSSPERSFTPAG